MTAFVSSQPNKFLSNKTSKWKPF